MESSSVSERLTSAANLTLELLEVLNTFASLAYRVLLTSFCDSLGMQLRRLNWA
jgi:hypothetical protein